MKRLLAALRAKLDGKVYKVRAVDDIHLVIREGETGIFASA